MTGFTSGTQARDGHTVNHDCAPNRAVKGGVRFGHEVAKGMTRIGVEWVYDPRPEFAVLDNPILAAFRKHGPEFFGGIDGWLKYAMHGTHCAGVPLPEGAIDHARRVLSKLAAPA